MTMGGHTIGCFRCWSGIRYRLIGVAEAIVVNLARFGNRDAVVPGVLLWIGNLRGGHQRLDLAALGHQDPALLIDAPTTVPDNEAIVCDPKRSIISYGATPLCVQGQPTWGASLGRTKDTLHHATGASVRSTDALLLLCVLRYCHGL